MALLGNGVRLFTTSPVRVRGLSSRLATPSTTWTNSGGMRSFDVGEGTAGTSVKSARPTGYTPPATWHLPQVAGGMASRGRLVGSGEVTFANLAGGLNAEAALSGSGDITAAALALVVSAVASLSGSATLTADITGKLEAAASLTGSSSLAANLGALADLVASLSGNTTVVASLSGVGSMASDINASSTLTVGAIADAVWDEVLASHLVAGSTGAALNGAGSAGDPWGTAIPGAYGAGSAGKLLGDLLADGAVDGQSALESLRIALAVLAGKTTIVDMGGGVKVITFRDMADTKDRATIELTGNERTDSTVDGT